VPPLRRRLEDVPQLARHFLTHIAAEEGKRVRGVSAAALALLGAYRWPGNVRQLENAIFRAVVLAEGDEIGVAEFPQIATQFEPLAADTMPLIAHAPATAAAWPEPTAAGGAGSSLCLVDGRGEVRPLEDIETEVIRFALAHYRGQMSEVARRLKIGRSTLYRKLDALGLGGDIASAQARAPAD